VGFEIAPDPGEKGVPDTGTAAPGGADLGERREIVADGVQVLAPGALVCPECALPIAIDRRLGAGTPVACPYCDHTAPARHFVRPDVFDGVASEIYLVARVN
jgi:hypothetical protein